MTETNLAAAKLYANDKKEGCVGDYCSRFIQLRMKIALFFFEIASFSKFARTGFLKRLLSTT